MKFTAPFKVCKVIDLVEAFLELVLEVLISPLQIKVTLFLH